MHRVRLREANPRGPLGIEQLPQLRLLGVVRARRIPRSRTNAAVFLVNQLVVRQSLPC